METTTKQLCNESYCYNATGKDSMYCDKHRPTMCECDNNELDAYAQTTQFYSVTIDHDNKEIMLKDRGNEWHDRLYCDDCKAEIDTKDYQVEYY